MLRKIALLTLLISLSGCAGIFLAGAATGGLVVYDRRNLKVMAMDQKIRHDLGKQIYNDPTFANSHLVISSFNGRVVLAGQTPLASLRVKAEKIATAYPTVKKVYNEISISSPTSNITQASDVWLTTKVKTALLATDNLKSSQIKVLTENGTVFLIGEVDPLQENLAVDVARRIEGVEKIVKVFS